MKTVWKALISAIAFILAAGGPLLAGAEKGAAGGFFPKGTGSAAGIGPMTVQSFDALVAMLAKGPIYGGPAFSAEALREIFAAAGCDAANVLAARAAPDTGVVLCYDGEGRQRVVLNVIRPEGLNRFPLVFVNPMRKLYSPDSGFEIWPSGLSIMMGGTVIDSDLGAYQITVISADLTKALGIFGGLVGLQGQANQYLLLEGPRFYRGLVQSKSGTVIRFDIGKDRILYYVEDLQRLAAGDTVAVQGINGAWWVAEVAAPLTAEGVLPVVPTRAWLSAGGEAGPEVTVSELILQDRENDVKQYPYHYDRAALAVKMPAPAE